MAEVILTGFPPGGTIPVDQLGTGTPTGSKFLRDDGTWATPPTGEGGSLPAGCILMWHGLLANIPTGFVLCDGQNGTPDLRDKFVKGAAASANPGSTGGALTHTHSDHASHTHTYTEIVNHTHPVTDPGHTHNQQRHGTATGSLTGITTAPDTSSSNPAAMGPATASATTGITTANPAGGVATGTTNGPGAALTHSSASNEPAFYEVAFIMKT